LIEVDSTENNKNKFLLIKIMFKPLIFTKNKFLWIKIMFKPLIFTKNTLVVASGATRWSACSKRVGQGVRMVPADMVGIVGKL